MEKVVFGEFENDSVRPDVTGIATLTIVCKIMMLGWLI